MTDQAVAELFQPFAAGTLKLRNRIVMPAMGVRLGVESGEVTQRFLDYYAERARGGAGLIIVGACAVRARPGSGSLTIHSDSTIIGLSELVEHIKEWGAAAAVQLIDHGGVVTATGELVPRGADDCTTQEIEGLVEDFAAAAARAKKAGFDAVEIHGAHGYLIAQFLSPLTNHRDDQWGGDVARRAAFPLAIIKRVRQAVGRDYPLLFRLSADEYLPGGVTLEQAKVTAKLVEAAGVDILNVTGGKRPESFEWSVQPMSLPRGCLTHLARAMKETVKIPVVAVGRINDPLLANRIIAEKQADLVAMGRAFLADPEMPRKAAEGRFDDIRQCIACMCCHQRNFLSLRPRCAVNAALGRERDFVIHQAAKAKRILIAGAGPAGLEAARVLALRGHQVVLCEKGDNLGGQARLAALPPYKEEIQTLLEYLTGQVRKLGVDVRLRTTVDRKTAAALGPDAIVVATGGEPVRADIPGADSAHVLTAQEVLSQGGITGDNAIIIGGGFIGCEMAEYLSGQGKSVALVEITGKLAQNALHPFLRKLLGERISRSGIKVYCSARVSQIKEKSAVITPESGKPFDQPADTVVLALGCQRATGLAGELGSRFKQVYAIGECSGEAAIHRAIADGARIGLWL
ncbi:MAG: FAD-dependent oxidoreductase [Chloroflexota bacterium]